MKKNPIPIIAIDGTSSSGKGTISWLIAHNLGYHYLNTGALYRLSAHLAVINNIDINDSHEANLDRIVSLASDELKHVSFIDKQVIYKDHDIWPLISSQEVGNMAAQIAPYPPLRAMLKEFERKKIQMPGLVIDGRASIETFPDAHARIYLDASVEARATRRLKDEEKRSSGKTYEMLCEELEKRDYSDKNRPVGALRVSEDALYIDTSDLTIEKVLEKCLAWCEEKGIKKN